VHLPQPPKKSSYLLYFYFYFYFVYVAILSIRFYRVFGRFVPKRQNFFSKKSIWLITKNAPFFRPFFFPFSGTPTFTTTSDPPVVLLDFFYRVFGRFVTRGVQKRD
jgi:hypothetical protein